MPPTKRNNEIYDPSHGVSETLYIYHVFPWTDSVLYSISISHNNFKIVITEDIPAEEVSQEDLPSHSHICS